MEKEEKIIVVIPTCSFNRVPMLVKGVESIQAGTYKNVHIVVVADGNLDIFKIAGTYFENKESENVTVILNKERMDWIFSVNRVFREFDSDYYIYAADDLFFPPACIEYAMIKMRQRFPDGFGVVGIGKKHKCAFGLLGRRFADHFPGQQVFCPDYVHYGSDAELWRTANKLGNIDYIAHRPSSVGHRQMKDETWEIAERSRARDQAIYRQREEMGLSWGVDFKLVAGK